LIGFNLPGFTFLVPAHPGGPGQIPEEQKTVVSVCVYYSYYIFSVSVIVILEQIGTSV